MSPIEQVLHDVVTLLERLGIPYALIGQFAVGVHGVADLTEDVDVMIQIEHNQLANLALELAQLGYAASEKRLATNLDQIGGMPYVRATTKFAGRTLVADIFLAQSELQESAMGRRLKSRLVGFDRWVVSAEDLILLKVIPSRPRDLADIRDVLELNTACDAGYLRKWADRLGVSDRLEVALGS